MARHVARVVSPSRQRAISAAIDEWFNSLPSPRGEAAQRIVGYSSRTVYTWVSGIITPSAQVHYLLWKQTNNPEFLPTVEDDEKFVREWNLTVFFDPDATIPWKLSKSDHQIAELRRWVHTFPEPEMQHAAEVLGVGHSHLSSFYSGNEPITAPVLSRLFTLTGLSVFYVDEMVMFRRWLAAQPSREAAAAAIGISETALMRWTEGTQLPLGRYHGKVRRLLEAFSLQETSTPPTSVAGEEPVERESEMAHAVKMDLPHGATKRLQFSEERQLEIALAVEATYKGLTTAQRSKMAAQLGVSCKVVNSWCRMGSMPSIIQLYRLWMVIGNPVFAPHDGDDPLFEECWLALVEKFPPQSTASVVSPDEEAHQRMVTWFNQQPSLIKVMEKIGISSQTLTRWLRGEQTPRGKRLRKLQAMMKASAAAPIPVGSGKQSVPEIEIAPDSVVEPEPAFESEAETNQPETPGSQETVPIPPQEPEIPSFGTPFSHIAEMKSPETIELMVSHLLTSERTVWRTIAKLLPLLNGQAIPDLKQKMLELVKAIVSEGSLSAEDLGTVFLEEERDPVIIAQLLSPLKGVKPQSRRRKS